MDITDRKLKAQRRRIRKVYYRWRVPLTLDEWTITLAYSRGPFELDGAVSDMAAAACKVDWPYRRATITFDLQLISSETEADLEMIIVHELCHVLVREMRGGQEDALDHEERVVTTMARAFLQVRDARPL